MDKFSNQKHEGRGEIVQGELRIDVAYGYELLDTGRRKMWRGAFSGAPGAEQPVKGEAVLDLGEGGQGKILITDVGDGTGNGWFAGAGPPPGIELD